MNRAFFGKVILLVITLAAAVGLPLAASLSAGGQSVVQSPSIAQPFAAAVDLKGFSELAVHTEGRVKSFDSFARNAMQYVSGASRIDGQSAAFTYLDMMFRPQAYADRDVVYFKNKLMRRQVSEALEASLHAVKDAAPMPEAKAQMDALIRQADERLAKFEETGLISPRMLQDDRVHELMSRLSTDILRSAKPVQAIATALSVMDPQALRMNLKLVAPPGGTMQDPWVTIEDLNAASPRADVSKIDPKRRDRIAAAWSGLQAGWEKQDAAAANAAIAELADLLPGVNPEVYPKRDRLSWEAWYFRMHNMTWVWLIYAFALIPLLLAVVFRWSAARWIGLLMFLAAFGWHTFAVMLRWYVADRWPNSNMFEAVTTSAWFGGCAAILLETIARKSPMRNLFVLGSAVASMVALMAVHFLPLELNANIGNMMPVLNDVWLYIHTNVIIFSYCVIFIAAVSAAIYLAYRLVALLGDWADRAEYARVGGAGSLILTRPDGTSFMERKKSTFGQVLDGTTMVMMEVGFVMLWTGLCMGAIWADHSWGRPWGWDPKEVFALNTFIIFLLLVHVRLKVKDKGLWTAVLAVIGAIVMVFNWVIINFAISGLHSYA